LKPKTIQSSTSIVIVGNFAPLTFLPIWFAQHGILAEGEARSANLQFASPEVVSFKTDSLTVAIETNKYTVVTELEPHIIAFDFVKSTFALISETPVSAIGINRSFHFDCGDIDALHKIGDRLAPKGVWGEYRLKEDGSRRAGLRSMVMQIDRTSIDPKGVNMIRIEPSVIMPHKGLFIEVNDHNELMTTNKQFSNIDIALEMLDFRWDASLEFTKKICQQIFEEDQI
jgi:hypothetical protein